MYGNGGGNFVSVCVLSAVYFYNGNILPEFCSSPVTLKLSLIFFLLLQFAVSWAWFVGVLLDVLSWRTRGPGVQVGLWMVSRASLYFVGLMVKPVWAYLRGNYVLFGMLGWMEQLQVQYNELPVLILCHISRLWRPVSQFAGPFSPTTRFEPLSFEWCSGPWASCQNPGPCSFCSCLNSWVLGPDVKPGGIHILLCSIPVPLYVVGCHGGTRFYPVLPGRSAAMNWVIVHRLYIL